MDEGRGKSFLFLYLSALFEKKEKRIQCTPRARIVPLQKEKEGVKKKKRR